MNALFRIFILLLLLGGLTVAKAAPLTTIDYRVSGQVLQVRPAALAVPKNIAGSVMASLSGAVPEGAFVEATLRGPSFPARRLVGAANAALLLPPLNLSGDYSLDGIRLASADGRTLLEGTPASVPVKVFDEVLVSRVTSRPLSLDEIGDRGIVIDQSNFRAIEFEIGFVLDGQTFPVKFPVVTPKFTQSTEIIPAAELEERLARVDAINQELASAVQLPKELETVNPNIQVMPFHVQTVRGGAEDLGLGIPPIPALMVIPGNVGFLNQFFSVQIFTENGAPGGSGLSVRDVSAELILPVGPDRVAGTFAAPGDDPVRFARVGAAAEIRNVIAVRAAGPDGTPGTADDVERLQPGQAGQGEFLVEGLQEGLHILDLKLKAKLDGLAVGTVEVEGRAAGSVQVSNPKFSLAFSHPATVRTGEPYEASATILNTSNTVANLVSISLNPLNISGGLLKSPERVELGTIRPGETATATWKIESQRTGEISFSNITTSDDSLVGRFRLRVGVDERGVALSRNSLILPDFLRFLPEEVLAAANRVLGQAMSVSTAAQLPPGVIRVPRSFVSTTTTVVEGKTIRNGGGIMVQQLAEAAERVRYGESLARVLPDLLLDWQGGRNFDPGWDQIIRTTDAGRAWREALMRAMENADLAPDHPVTRLVERGRDLAGRGESWFFAAVSRGVFQGTGPAGELSLTTSSGKAATGSSTLAQAVGYGGREGAWLVASGPGEVQWKFAEALPGLTQLSVLKTGADGTAVEWLWDLTDLAAGACASWRGTDPEPNLLVDDNCDGTVDRVLPAVVSPFTEAPPRVLVLKQNPEIKVGRPTRKCFEIRTKNDLDQSVPVENYGNVLAILFSKPMTQAGAGNAAAYLLEGGNRAASVQVQPGGRIALLALRQPMGALVPRSLTIGPVITDLRGNPVAAAAALPILTRLEEGFKVRGRILRPDGSAGANLPVTLTYNDKVPSADGCEDNEVRVTQIFSDPDGTFAFDLVLAGIPFSLSTTDVTNVRDNQAIAIILESSIDGAVTEARLNDLGASVAGSEEQANAALRRAFGVASISQAIALAEGLDRAVVRDFAPVGRQGADGVYVLRFRGRASVTGRVLLADGVTPVAGAAVNLFPDPDSRELGRGILSDANGAFAFLGVPLGTTSVEATSPGGLTRTLSTLISGSGSTVDLPILLSQTVPARVTVQGQVTEPDGSPHSGATVIVKTAPIGTQAVAELASVAVVTSDGSGFYTATQVPVGGQVTVFAVSADGRRKGERNGLSLTAGVVNTVNVSLQARAVVRGRVEFANGDPVPGAIVGGGEVLVTTDALGAFTLPGVPTGPRSVSAGLDAVRAHPDPRRQMSRVGSASLNVLPGADNFAVIRFNPAGRIAGVVLDENGAAVPNSDIAIPLDSGTDEISNFAWVDTDGEGKFVFDNFGLGIWNLSTPAPPHDDPKALDKAQEQVRSGDLDQVIAGLKTAFAAFTGAGDPFLNGGGEAFKPGRWGVTQNVRLEFDGQTVVVPVKYLARAAISGTVKNSQDVPIGAKVRLTGIGPRPNGYPAMTIRGELNSDPALGTFAFNGAAFVGDWGLQAASPFFPVVVSQSGRTTTADPVAAGILLKFPSVRETNGSLSGQVLQADGTPAGGNIKVQISFGPDFVIRTDGTGRFATTAGTFTLPADGYTVTALDEVTGATAQISAQVTAGQNNEVTLRLLGRGDALITVKKADGTPAAGAAVEMQGGQFPRVRFDGLAGPDGTVVFSNVFEGPYAACASLTVGGTRVAGRSSLVVTAGSGGSTLVTLGGTGTVRGQFVRTDGVTPVPFANVSLAGLAVAPTDGEGRFSLPDVPLGSYRLTAVDDQTARSGFANVLLSSPGQLVEVRLVETPLGTVRGLVLSGFANTPVPNAEVKLALDDPLASQPRRTVTTGPDGAFSFAGVPPGGLSLDALDQLTRLQGQVRGTMPAGVGTVEVNIPLEATAVLTVQVFEPDGTTPASGVTVRMGTLAADTGTAGQVSFGNVLLGRSYGVVAVSNQPGQTRSFASAPFRPVVQGAAEKLTLTLRGVGVVEGQVFLGDGTTPVAGAQVKATMPYTVLVSGRSVAVPSGGQKETIVADDQGRFRFGNIPVGTLQLAAFSLAQGAQAQAVLTNPGSTVTKNLILTASGTVTGRLVRPDGLTPAAGAEVVIRFTSASNADGSFLIATGEDGRFAFSPVTVGNFTVSATLLASNGLARFAGSLTTNGEVFDTGDLVLDEAFPTVVSTVPADTADHANINAPVEVLFSEALDPATVNNTGVFVRPSGGGTVVAANVTLEAPSGETQNRLVRLTPLQPLRSSTTYQLVVVDGELLNATGEVTNRGPRDRVGRPLPALFSATFTTRDQRPPGLLSFTPETGAEQVDVTSTVRLSFDEPVQQGAVITLTGPSGPVAGAVSLGVNSIVLTFVPQVPLPPNATFTASVSGVQDLAGNPLDAQPRLTTFSTLDTLGPVLAELRVKNGQAPVALSTITLEAVLAAAEPGVRYRLSANAITVGTTAENGLELPFVLPATGSVVFRGIAIDRFGNEGPLRELTVAVQENQPPVIAFTRLSPPTGPVFSGSGFGVRVNASDDGSVTELRAAATGAASVPLQTSSGGPLIVQSFVPATAVPGTLINITALATDNSGSSSGQVLFPLTVADGTAPAVEFLAPAANAVMDPALSSQVQVRWSDNSGAATLRIELSGSVTGQVETTVTAAPNTLATASLTLPLEGAPLAGGAFTASLTGTDAAGRSRSVSRSFTLPDRRAPQLTHVAPAADAVGQSLWTDILISFDESMKADTLTAASFEFPGTLAISANPANTLFTLRPAAALAPGTQHTIRLKPGITDLAGNPWQANGGGLIPPEGLPVSFTTATLAVVAPAVDLKVVPGQTINAKIDFEAGLGADAVAFQPLSGAEILQTLNPSASTSATAAVPISLTAVSGETLTIALRRSGRPDFSLPGIPLDVRLRTADDDGDGIPNGQEADLGLDPFFDDRTLDPDNDGRNNAQEVLAGTDPNDPDSDNDGLDDGAEFLAGTNPLSTDTDDDSISDSTDRRPLIANVAPTPQNDVATVRPGESIQFPQQTFLANDTDADGDTLRVDFNFQPTVLHGTAFYTSVPGVFGYTPDPAFSGVDTLTYQVIDEGGLMATATVTITVGANHAPVAGELVAYNNRGLEFDGSDDAVIGPILASISENFTFECWVNPGRARAGISETNAGASAQFVGEFAVFPNHGSNGLGGDPHAGAGLSVGTNGFVVVEHAANYFPSPLVFNATVNSWTHVAVVYQNNQPKLYVNGELVRTGIASVRVVHPSTDLSIALGRYRGQMDEYRVWNFARSEAEIAADFGRRLSGSEPGLAVYWRMDEASGLTLLGSDPAVRNGTLTGGTARQASGAPVRLQGQMFSTVQEATIPLVLTGTDADGNPLTARIKSLPAHGQLFQRAPGGGPGSEIASVPVVVDDAGRRVFYRPAAGFLGEDVFSYTVHDGVEESEPALALLRVAVPVPPQTDDLWDISQGAVVTNSTGFLSNAGANMFGAAFGVEPGNAIFADGHPAGFTHAVEWRTAGLVRLEGARLAAIDEPNNGQRGFTEMRLFGRQDSTAPFTLLSTFRPGENPYFPTRFLKTSLEFAPFIAQEFRAEFDQFGNFSFPGPRVEELDAIGEPVVLVPIPAQVVLQNATADRSQGGFPVSTLIDGNTASGGWAGDVGGTPPMTAVFETTANIGATADTEFTFRMPQPFGGQHFIGCFRLSATTDERSSFADGLSTGGDITANWSVLDVIEATSTGGETITLLPDKSILIGGNMPSTTNYTVRAKGITGGVTGFRLELLEHPSLPNNGPGRVGHGNWVLAEFSVQVEGATRVPNRAPNAVADAAQTPQGFAVTTGNVLANDTDPEGDTISVFDFTQPAAGTGSVVNNNNGTFTWTPPDGLFTGTSSFTYRATDPHQPSRPATVTITVNPTNIVAWNNPSGGNWNTANNWIPARVPGADDIARISLPGTYTVTLNTDAAPLSAQVGGSGVSATLQQTAGTFAPIQASGVAVGSTYQLEGGILRGTATFTLNGALVWSGGSMLDAGKTLLAAGATGTISGGNSKDLAVNRILENAGTLTVSGGTVFFNRDSFGGGAVINNLAGATLEVQGETDFSHNFSSVSAINNAGLFRKTGGGETRLTSNRIALNNTGTVEILSGTLTLEGGGSNSGTFTAAAGGTAEFAGGTYTHAAGSVVNLSGGLTSSGGVVVFDGPVTALGSLTVSGGEFTFNQVLTNGPALNLSGGTVRFNASQSFATLTQSGGNLRGTGTITVTDSLAWTGGSMLDGGKTLLAASAASTISGATVKDLAANRILENTGTLTVSGGTVFFNLRNFGSGAVINNLAGATLEVQGETDFSQNFTTVSAINNAGLFRKTGGGETRLTSSTIALNNTGTVEIVSGTLRLEGGGSNSGTFTAAAGGTADFAGGTYTHEAGSVVNLSGGLTSSGGGVVFNEPVTALGTLTVSGGDFTFNQALTNGPALNLSGGTVRFNASQSFATLTQSGGNLGGTGTITVTDSLAWTGGSMLDAGKTLLAAGAASTISGATVKDLAANRILENAGTLTVSGGTVFFNLRNFGSGAVINNLAGATLEVQGETDFSHNFTTVSAINNAGLFRKTGGGETRLTASTIALNNTGTVEIVSGTLKLEGGGSLAGNIDVQSAGVLDFNGGSLLIAADSNLGGAGGLSLTGGNATFAGTLVPTGPVSISNGNWTFNANQVFQTLTISGGSLRGTGTVTVTGSLAWTGGSMLDAGKTLLATGATGTISGATVKDLAAKRILENAGTLTVSGGTVFFNLSNFGSGAVINNLAGATLEVQGETDFSHNFNSPGSAINNAGLFRKTGGGTTELTASTISLNNTGSLSVEEGTLLLNGGGILGGSLGVAGAGVLNLGGGNFAVPPLTTSSSSGMIALTGGTGTIGETLGVTAGSIDLRGGSWTFSADQSFPSLTLSGGTLRGTGTVTVTNVFSWTGGGMMDAGKTLIAGTATGTISGGSGKGLDLNRVLENAGTLIASGGDLFFNLSNAGGGAVINNLAGAVFEAQGELDFRHNFTSAGSGFNNSGLFRRTGGGTTEFTASSIVVTNNGTIELVDGTLKPDAGLVQNGIIRGSGTLVTNLTNNGTIQAAATPGGLTLQGNYVQTAAGHLALNLAGSVAPLGHNGFRITGTASFNGALDLSLAFPFSGTAGAVFPVISYASRSGDFAATTGLTGNFGYDFSRSFDGTALNLTVLTEGELPPPPAAIMAAGFEQWMDHQAVAAGASGLSGRDEDADGDGVSNFEEYAFGTPPFQAGPALQPVASTWQESGLTWAVLEFRRRTDTPALQYQIIGSTGLGDWSLVSDTMELSRSPIPGQPGLEMVRLAVWPALDPGVPRFLKVQVREIQPALPLPRPVRSPKAAAPLLRR